MAKHSWAKRIDSWIRGTPPFIILVLLGLTLTSGYVVWQAVSEGRDFYRETYLWRDEEYDKINSLHGGISIAKVEEVLGSPYFVRVSSDGSFTESTFEGRDYWVQAVHGPDGTVELIAVTSCSNSFKPRIESPIGTVVLNESFFNSLPFDPAEIRSFTGATASSHFFDGYWGGNPGFYKTYFLGINNACPAVRFYGMGDELASINHPDGIDFALVKPDVEYFRANSIINTYAESAPGTNLIGHLDFAKRSDILSHFQIGVDRILVRTFYAGETRGYGTENGELSEYWECMNRVDGSYLDKWERLDRDRPAAPSRLDSSAPSEEIAEYEREFEEYKLQYSRWQEERAAMAAEKSQEVEACMTGAE